MLIVDRYNSMDEIVKRCCTLCIIRPGTLCYIVCKPSEEQVLRLTIFKEIMQKGDRFIWYEIRRETVIGSAWSRIRLLPIAGTKNQDNNLQGVRGDIFAIEHMNNIVNLKAVQLAKDVLMYVDYIDEEEDEE